MAARRNIRARQRRCNPRKRILLPLLVVWCLTAGIAVWAAGPGLEWVKLVGAPPGDRGMFCYAVATDSQENIYVGSGPNLALSKLDSVGNRIWTFGLQPNDHNGAIFVQGIEIDSSNHVYVAGNISGNVSLGTLSYNRNDPAMFIAKMTPTGSIIFVKFFYNLFTENKPLARGSNGTLFVGGLFRNDVTYEGIMLSPTANFDAAVFKLNADGSPIWARRAAGSLDEYVHNVAATDSGDVITTGTSSSASFGMAGRIISGSGPYLISIDGAGNGRWATNVAGDSARPTAVAHSRRSDAVIWAGNFAGSLGLVSPPISSSGGSDVFVAKVSSSGNVVWARKLGGTQDQFANAAAVDVGGNIYVAGFFFGQMTIGAQTFTSRGLQDIFVAKLREDGTPLWAKQIGWTGRDGDAALSFTRAGHLLVVGSASGGVLVDDVFLEGTGPSDGFLAKFRVEGLPPRFVTHPQSQVISGGMTISLMAGASSDLPLTYQWWFNGSPLSGKTNATLTMSNVQPAHAGSYYLVASNAVGEAQSDAALLSYSDASTLILSVHPSLTIYGTPGRRYQIEYATETRGVAQWTIATNLTLTSTPQIWIDPDAAIGEKRFYRVLLQP